MKIKSLNRTVLQDQEVWVKYSKRRELARKYETILTLFTCVGFICILAALLIGALAYYFQ